MATNRYTPGERIKMNLGEGKELDQVELVTVVRQYPFIVHITYRDKSGNTISRSMSPWEIEKRRVNKNVRLASVRK